MLNKYHKLLDTYCQKHNITWHESKNSRCVSNKLRDVSNNLQNVSENILFLIMIGGGRYTIGGFTRTLFSYFEQLFEKMGRRKTGACAPNQFRSDCHRPLEVRKHQPSGIHCYGPHGLTITQSHMPSIATKIYKSHYVFSNRLVNRSQRRYRFFRNGQVVLVTSLGFYCMLL